MTGYEVVVIGGGQAGLAMGHHLRRRGADFAILDAGDSLGQVWRSRWDSLRLFTPARYAALPGLPFPAPGEIYPGKDQVAGYLRDYAAAFELPVRLNTRVTALARGPEGYLLTTGAGPVRARAVVVATGPFQTPFVPSTSAGFAAEVGQLHSSQYRNPGQLAAGPVLVVGGGNSGFQIAEELAATHRVHLAIGTRNATIPQRPLGRDIFWWQTVTGLINAPATSRRGRWMRRGEGTVIGVSVRDLRRAGVTIRPRVVAAQGERAVFADGSGAPVGTVVWATGYRRDHSWIQIPSALDEHGHLRQDRGVTPVPGLYVLGLPWQHSAGSALLGFVGRDAARLAGHIAVETHR
ncbi:flavin-containing monooxygenase [Crossiella sp. NPDC003009]